MGRGDKKSKKGKIWRGTFGNSRKKKTIKARLKRGAQRGTSSKTSAEGAAAKKAPRKKAEA
jgi:ribosomal small subunit protein bTHX